MHVAIYLPFVASLLLGRAAPGLARRLPPPTAARLLAGAAVLAAAATLVSLAVLAATLVGRLPAVAAVERWSPQRLAAADPVPNPLAAFAVLVLCLAALNAVRVVVARTRALLAARSALGGLPAGAGGLVVVDDGIEAVAVPVAGGRIVVSRALLSALPAVERRALLLHERAHLAHRHHLYRLAADLAGALDPLQLRVRGAVGYATERWADEAAAAGVGDRAAVARVLARSGLRRASSRPWAAVALGAGGTRVVARVQALLEPAPRQRPGLLLAAAALVALAVGSALHAERDSDAWFDRAGVHPVCTAEPQPGGACRPLHDHRGIAAPAGTTASRGE
jgi:Peptidase family M48